MRYWPTVYVTRAVYAIDFQRNGKPYAYVCCATGKPRKMPGHDQYGPGRHGFKWEYVGESHGFQVYGASAEIEE